MKKLTYTILVNADPYRSQSAYTAYRFAVAVLASGHDIKQIFFNQAAVLISLSQQNLSFQRRLESRALKKLDSSLRWNDNSISDENSLKELWQQFIADHDISAVICSAAVDHYGIAELYNKTIFTLGGLSQLHEAILETDRFIQFGR